MGSLASMARDARLVIIARICIFVTPLPGAIARRGRNSLRKPPCPRIAHVRTSASRTATWERPLRSRLARLFRVNDLFSGDSRVCYCATRVRSEVENISRVSRGFIVLALEIRRFNVIQFFCIVSGRNLGGFIFCRRFVDLIVLA